MTFQALAVEGSQQYYAYLDQYGKGVVSIDVLKISCVDGSALFDLTLGQIPFNPDGLQIKIGKETLGYNDIHAVEFTRASRILRVRTSAPTKAKLLCVAPSDIKVISDVKFLVKRVEDWYRQYGNQVLLPTKRPIVLTYTETGSQAPSFDQSAAIEGAHSHPFTYIWGAPGTGKTKFVLARCVLSYLKSEKRILIAAPTNNAVEQTLYGILDVLQAAGIDYKGSLLRLGMASAEFASKYPDACEDRLHTIMLATLTDEIDSIQSEIVKLEARYSQMQKYATLQAEWNCFCQIKADLNHELAQLDALQKQIASIQTQLHLSSGKYTALNTQKQQSEQELVRAAIPVKSYSEKVQRYAQGWRHTLFPKRLALYQVALMQALDKSGQLERQIEVLNLSLSDISGFQQTLKQKLCQCSNQMQTVLLRLKTTSQPLKPVAKLIHKQNETVPIETILHALSQCEASLEQQLASAEPPEGLSLDETSDALALQKQNLSAAQKKKSALEASFSAKAEKYKILAATVDACIGRLLPGDALCNFSHVFLDEAGYCSLVKAAILTAYHCPLTFLGDHMQLPPVCEMNDEEIRKSPSASVWAQSALYVENALLGEDIAAGYLNHCPPRFFQMKKFDLVHTYRFGGALATILAQTVYSAQFHGNSNGNTEILFIHAPRISGKLNRTNLGECAAIQRFLSTHPNENLAILTPYRNQRVLLADTAKKCGYPQEISLTVHRAQGREWDTVLFSVVDTADKFLTSILIPKSHGTQVINTAVSRAKKRLILVCDCDYWSQQSKELIGQLLQVAHPDTSCSV